MPLELAEGSSTERMAAARVVYSVSTKSLRYNAHYAALPEADGQQVGTVSGTTYVGLAAARFASKVGRERHHRLL